MMKKPINYKTKSFEDTYANMCELKRDLYYKDIINAHKDVLVSKTKERVDEVFDRYKKSHISKNEMFTELESLQTKNYIIDQVVYEGLSFARKNFCKPRGKRVPSKK